MVLRSNARYSPVQSGGSTAETTEQPPFPLSVDPFHTGWCVVVHLGNGRHWRLLKPGWECERNDPYVFESPTEAWSFLRKIFQFCARQQNPHMDKLTNCTYCGKVYRARFLTACEDCTMKNDYLMQQIWQGFHFTSGSYDEVIMRLAMLLNVTPEMLLDIKTACALMVEESPGLTPCYWEDNETGRPVLKKQKARSASSRRKRSYGLGSR